jgi:hypothetical protein
MYKKLKNDVVTGQPSDTVQRLSDNAFIPFDPANTDYANFKKQINAETAELKDADGNTMTAAEAKAYIATLP